ncbi:hypothetical protein EDB84DRAFT_1433491 [Lactarius hengduanensis]|nr:hypothetical protein EDB84DRAFT_1433491 [Lactarius hengduanensis]
MYVAKPPHAASTATLWERPRIGTCVSHHLVVVSEALESLEEEHTGAVQRIDDPGLLFFFWFNPARFSALGVCAPGAIEERIDTVEGRMSRQCRCLASLGKTCGDRVHAGAYDYNCNLNNLSLAVRPSLSVAKRKAGTAAPGPKAISKIDLTRPFIPTQTLVAAHPRLAYQLFKFLNLETEQIQERNGGSNRTRMSLNWGRMDPGRPNPHTGFWFVWQCAREIYLRSRHQLTLFHKSGSVSGETVSKKGWGVVCDGGLMWEEGFMFASNLCLLIAVLWAKGRSRLPWLHESAFERE